VPTASSREKVTVLMGMGWSCDAIAASLQITAPTFYKHYGEEIETRRGAREVVEGRMIMRLWDKVLEGSVPAISAFRAILKEENGEAPKIDSSPSRMGKKAMALVEARQADPDDEVARVLLQRQGPRAH